MGAQKDPKKTVVTDCNGKITKEDAYVPGDGGVDFAAMARQMTTMQTQIATLQTNEAALLGRVSTLETEVDELQDRVFELEMELHVAVPDAAQAD